MNSDLLLYSFFSDPKSVLKARENPSPPLEVLKVCGRSLYIAIFQAFIKWAPPKAINCPEDLEKRGVLAFKEALGWAGPPSPELSALSVLL